MGNGQSDGGADSALRNATFLEGALGTTSTGRTHTRPPTVLDTPIHYP
jgi:hypothetical protein